MEFFSKNKKVIIGLFILAGLIYFGYATVFNVPSSGGLTDSGGMESTTEDLVAQDILNSVEQFKNISIDSSIFSSNLFKSLKDSSALLTPELQGRANPFASFGNEPSYTPPAVIQTSPIKKGTSSIRTL